MIREVIIAVCDNCKKKWRDPLTEIQWLYDKESMECALEENDWHFGDDDEGKYGEHYCPDCWGYDDEDNFVLSH